MYAVVYMSWFCIGKESCSEVTFINSTTVKNSMFKYHVIIMLMISLLSYLGGVGGLGGGGATLF